MTFYWLKASQTKLTQSKGDDSEWTQNKRDRGHVSHPSMVDEVYICLSHT